MSRTRIQRMPRVKITIECEDCGGGPVTYEGEGAMVFVIGREGDPAYRVAAGHHANPAEVLNAVHVWALPEIIKRAKAKIDATVAMDKEIKGSG